MRLARIRRRDTARQRDASIVPPVGNDRNPAIDQ